MELIKCSSLPGEHWDSILEIRNNNAQGFGNSSIITYDTLLMDYPEHAEDQVEDPCYRDLRTFNLFKK